MYLDLHIGPEEQVAVISINVLLMVNIEIRHAQHIVIKALNYSAV